MSFIIRNNKISKILFIITISIILFSISLNVKAAENKIEIKDGNQIITDTTGTLKTPKVLNVNTNVEKKLTINYVGVDNNRLDYHLEEKEGNLDFDINVLTGEIKLKAKSGTNFGAVFSLVDRQTKKVYPISLVIRAIDGKSKVSLLGSVKNMKFNTISGNMYLEGIADLKRVIEGGINPLNEKPTMYLKNLNTQRTVELSVEKVSTYEYRFRIKAEDMAEDDKYTIYAKISKQNTYADNSSLERQLTIERAVPNTIENNRYKLTNSDDNISIKTKPVIYNLNANLVDMYGFHRGQNDYVIGTADIFLKDNDGNRVKPREVKIYAEKNGNKTYFNVYNNRYDFELLLNNVEAGEYTIYAEATGNNGKTYKEKLNISQGLRKNLTVSGMQTEARTGESKLVLTKKNKEKEPNYIIRTNTNSMYGFHRADGNDYIIGTADIFLSDKNGNRVKPREVKIYAEKDGNKTYFNVYNDRYDFELLLNNVEAGEYTIYAEAIGNDGKTYSEKLWIGGHLRKSITVSGMQTEARVEEGRIILKKKGEPNYIIRTNTNSMYGFHRGDGNDYIIGTADIFLSDENGNRVKPREVKIYAEKDGKKTYFNVYNDRYDFELLLNSVDAGEYTIYAEAVGNNGKTYSEKLWIGGHLRKNVTVSGMQTEAKVEEGRIILKKKEEPNYIIRTNTNSMYGFHRGDGNDYIIGTADIFLSDENGNRVKPKEVKIYAEKDGNKTYFNVYNDRYDFELLLNSVEAGEYTIYAEATGNNGKTYSEKLWIGSGLRRDITVNGMKKVAIISNNLLIEKREKDIEYELEQPELVALVDERQYIYGNLTVKLKEISNNSYTGIREVKIYAEKDGVKNQFYVKNIGNERYYYDFIINHLKNFENYNIYIEVEDNNGRIYRRGLDFSKIRKNRLIVRGFNRKVNLQGTNMYIEQTNNDEVDFEQGIYGQSGLKVKGDSRGQDLRYYKFGNGKNVFYATFALHGFEDLWNNDGKELTYIAERFKDYLIRIGKSNIFKDWTLYLFPQVNPDGTNHGWTNNGPGRTTIYSSAPGNRGIDLNRNFRAEGTEHTKFTGDRNYNGERGFEAYEAKFLAEFIKATQSKNGKNVLVDTHRMAWRNYRR